MSNVQQIEIWFGRVYDQINLVKKISDRTLYAAELERLGDTMYELEHISQANLTDDQKREYTKRFAALSADVRKEINEGLGARDK